MQAADRTQELKNFEYEEKIHNLNQKFNDFVTKEALAYEMSNKVTLPMLEQVSESLRKLQSISLTNDENYNQKVSMVKDELDGKTSNLANRIEELSKKVEELLQEDDSYGDEDEETD